MLSFLATLIISLADKETGRCLLDANDDHPASSYNSQCDVIITIISIVTSQMSQIASNSIQSHRRSVHKKRILEM